MKSLTGISQGFDKCTKATLQNNYFWGTPPYDCFCLEIRLRYHYNIKHRKFKTILIWTSSRKLNRNKNLLILYYLTFQNSKFSNTQKNVSHAFSYQLCSTASSKFSLYVSLCEINCIKIQAMSLVSKSIYFSGDSLCFIYFTSSCTSDWKKFKLVELFFSRPNEIKTCGLVQQLILGILRDPILQSCDFQSLKGTLLQIWKSANIFVFIWK